jgi:hypothetical protein
MVDPKKKIKPDDIIDGEVVSEFSDQTMMNLPQVPKRRAAEETAVDTGRRDFVTRIVLGGAAALALGGSAALLVNQRLRESGGTTEVILPYGGTSGGPATGDTADLVQRVADLEYNLAALTAERDQAISDLNVANTDLSELRSQLDVALAELAEAQEVNTLWQALDDIGLDSLVGTAFNALAVILTPMLEALSIVQTGIVLGQSAIQRLLQALPGPSDGIRWLAQRVAALSNDLEWLSQQVQQAVQPVEPFANLIAQFVLWVLDRLPFGAGDQARAGLEAMQTVINSLPDTVEGINTQVLNPLADWFGQDKSRNLVGTYVTPVQDRVIVPSTNLAEKVDEFKTAYQEQLVAPVQAALSERASIRSQIEAKLARTFWRA